jgi:hypothetical protein
VDPKSCELFQCLTIKEPLDHCERVMRCPTHGSGAPARIGGGARNRPNGRERHQDPLPYKPHTYKKGFPRLPELLHEAGRQVYKFDTYKKGVRPPGPGGVGRVGDTLGSRMQRAGRASDRESGGRFAVSFAGSALSTASGLRLPGVAEMVQKTRVEGVT